EYDKALLFAEKAKRTAQSEFGETHINYNKSLTNLAIVYDRKGMLSEAESVRIRSAEISKIIFGENSLECATAFNQLGLLYEKLKNIKKAESNYLLSISILRKQNPLDELLISVLYNLADFYEANDLVVKAIETYEQWEKTIEVIKGDSYTENPSGLTSFAILYKNTGQYKKAEPLFYRANEILKKTVGAEHPDYASSLSNLAGLYKDIGLYEKAEPLYIESTAIRKKTVGENHPDYARGLNNMAVLYDLMGQYEKAKMLYVQAIEIRKKTLGENHPDYAYSLINLAATLDNMGEKEQSEQFLLQAREIIKKTLGERHPSYSTCLNNLGGLYKKVGEFKKAEMLYNEAKEIRKTVLGENHTDYASSLSNLAILYTNLGEYKKAESLFIQAKKIREKAFGEKHPEYANSLSNLAMLYLTTGQYEDAQMLFSEGSKIETTNLLSVFTNLSEREKSNFLTNNFFLNSTTNSLVYNYRKASPDFYQGNNNLQLFLKSLSLASTKNTLDAARNSSDTTVQKVLINWQENKSILSKQFSLPVANRREDLKKIEEQTESLEKELTRRSSAFKNQQQVLQIKTTDVHKSLKENEVAIEFVRFQLYTKNWTDSMMYAAYILRKNDPAPIFVPLCEEKQLQKIFDSAGATATAMVSRFYRGLEVKNKNTAGSLGTELYRLIWQPLEPYLKKATKISYSPAGKLYSIAFHALPVDSATVLMDKYQLQQYTSTRQVVLREQEKQNSKPQNITLFGDASFTLDSLQIVKGKTKTENVSTN
ncbi:MAG: tetratricopeptide repeat protein, partial [Chitinophagaceae bacterium]